MESPPRREQARRRARCQCVAILELTMQIGDSEGRVRVDPSRKLQEFQAALGHQHPRLGNVRTEKLPQAAAGEPDQLASAVGKPNRSASAVGGPDWADWLVSGPSDRSTIAALGQQR